MNYSYLQDIYFLATKSDHIEKPSWNIDLKITLIVVRFSGEKGLKLWKFETYYL